MTGTEEITLPTPAERQAYNLRSKQGLSDAQIAELLRCARETVNRRINRFENKVNRIRVACASGQCTLLEMVLGN
jgi:DNA-directed RNA polymerase specialized sigma24 family protein